MPARCSLRSLGAFSRVLVRIAERRDYPRLIVSDQGNHPTSNATFARDEERQVEWHGNAPGKPMRNGVVESFIGRLHNECLNERRLTGYRRKRDSVEEASTGSPRPNLQPGPNRTTA